jgi:hypothetical protein
MAAASVHKDARRVPLAIGRPAHRSTTPSTARRIEPPSKAEARAHGRARAMAMLGNQIAILPAE